MRIFLFSFFFFSAFENSGWARNCDYFFYSGSPIEILRYDVSFIKKEIPDIYLEDPKNPISKSSDVAIEWSKQAADCLLNPKNGILTDFDDGKTLNRMRELKSSFDKLSTTYTDVSTYETRRINQALKKNLDEFKRSIKASEPSKISYLRGILTSSCGSFRNISTNLGIITALKAPIELRKKYIRDFCVSDQEASRAETLRQLEAIALQCNNGSTGACDLKDVFDSVDCSRVDDFLNNDFNGLIKRFEDLNLKIVETRNVCGSNIKSLIDTCIGLGLEKNVCLISASEAGACERLEIGAEYCAS